MEEPRKCGNCATVGVFVGARGKRTKTCGVCMSKQTIFSAKRAERLVVELKCGTCAAPGPFVNEKGQPATKCDSCRSKKTLLRAARIDGNCCTSCGLPGNFIDTRGRRVVDCDACRAKYAEIKAKRTADRVDNDLCRMCGAAGPFVGALGQSVTTCDSCRAKDGPQTLMRFAQRANEGRCRLCGDPARTIGGRLGVNCARCAGMQTKMRLRIIAELFENAPVGMQYCLGLCSRYIDVGRFASIISTKCRLCTWEPTPHPSEQLTLREDAMRDMLARGCACGCGREAREIDHIDPACKTRAMSDHTYWARFQHDEWLDEFNQCQPLARRCHVVKTSAHRMGITIEAYLERRRTTPPTRNQWIISEIDRRMPLTLCGSIITLENRLDYDWDHRTRRRDGDGKIISHLAQKSLPIDLVEEILKCDRRSYRNHKRRTRLDQLRDVVERYVPLTREGDDGNVKTLESRLARSRAAYDAVCAEIARLEAEDAAEVAANHIRTRAAGHSTEYPSDAERRRVAEEVLADALIKFPRRTVKKARASVIESVR
jgi:hypothetical protein